MNSDNLILRQTEYTPLINKDDFLDNADFDSNMINIYADLVSLCLTNGVIAYDISTEYDDTVINYATYSGKLWKFVNPVPALNVTPGTDELYWIEVFPTEMAHRKNSDTILDEGGSNEVTASEIRSFIDAGLTSTTNLSISEITDVSLKINSSTGSDVILLAANGKNAGLLNSTDKTKLNQLSGINSGDQTLESLGAEATANKVIDFSVIDNITFPTTEAVANKITSDVVALVDAELINYATVEDSTNASNLSSGIVAPERLGSGTADSTTYLRGDNTWQSLSSEIFYSNVYFVDPINGNDSTGLINRFDKPFQTYNAASSEALLLSPTQTEPALIVLRKGVYTDNMLLKPYVYIHCDEGVVFTINGFYDNVDTVYCRVYGKACFYANAQPLTQAWGSDIYFEFDECIQEATLFRGVISINANGYVQKSLVVCNRVESNCKNGFLITVRNGSEATIHVKQWIKGAGKMINVLYLTNVVKIICPRIICDNRVTPAAITSKSCVFAQLNNSTGVLEIYGDLYNTSDNFTYAPGSPNQQACICALQNVAGSLISVYGNLYANETFGIYTVNASGNDALTVNIKGNISSKSIPVCFLGQTNKLKVEGEITKTLNDTIAAPCIYAINSAEIYAKNVLFKNYNTVNSNIIALDSATSKGYFYNCVGYSLGLGDVFLKDASTGTFGCVNVKSNLPMGADAATQAFTPQDFTQVTGLVLPNF